MNYYADIRIEKFKSGHHPENGVRLEDDIRPERCPCFLCVEAEDEVYLKKKLPENTPRDGKSIDCTGIWPRNTGSMYIDTSRSIRVDHQPEEGGQGVKIWEKMEEEEEKIPDNKQQQPKELYILLQHLVR
ncbi:uncharacterized protein LOC143305532 [Osmia lignaria lignaria]|uniref:uncharacterized protein LOC143305532 n=1 Tax=Osmia lignaria lignaria TaxID=1437193 RepID=UPI00402B4E67